MTISYEIICKANAIVSLHAADAIGHAAVAYCGFGKLDEHATLYHLRRARETLQRALNAVDAALADEQPVALKTAA